MSNAAVTIGNWILNTDSAGNLWFECNGTQVACLDVYGTMWRNGGANSSQNLALGSCSLYDGDPASVYSQDRQAYLNATSKIPTHVSGATATIWLPGGDVDSNLNLNYLWNPWS